MMARRTLLTAAGGLALASLARPATAATDPSMHTQTVPPQYKLFDRDDFTAPTVDTTRWAVYDGKNPTSGETWRAGNAVIESNGLALYGRTDGSVGGVSYRTDLTYGYWEVDATFWTPADVDFCPVFMLWPQVDSTWPAAGEVDFAEIYDPNRGYIESWLHWGPPDTTEYAGKKTVDLTTQHTFAVEWQPDHISIFVDNEAAWYTFRNHIPTGPMHLVMQMDNMHPTRLTNFTPTKVTIRSIRIYQ